MHTVYLLCPCSPSCQEWIDENIECESWQRLGDGIAIEHRYIGAILKALENQGFHEGNDYYVTA